MSVQMQPAELSPTDIEQIKQSAQRWVQYSLSRDFDGLTSKLLTEDVQLLPPDHPACVGRAESLAYLNDYPTIEDFSVAVVDVTGRADIAVVRGTFDITVNIDGDSTRQIGKWLAGYKKTPSGWLITHDTWNNDAPLS